MIPNTDAAKEAARYAVATGAPAAQPRPMSPDDIHNRFSYHPPKSEGRKRDHEKVRDGVERLAMSWAGNLPDGRELSLAITKLEEAMFWANAALARAEEPVKGNSAWTQDEEENA